MRNFNPNCVVVKAGSDGEQAHEYHYGHHYDAPNRIRVAYRGRSDQIQQVFRVPVRENAKAAGEGQERIRKKEASRHLNCVICIC